MENKSTIATAIIYLLALVGVLPAVIYGVQLVLGQPPTSLTQVVHSTAAPVVFAILFCLASLLCFLSASKEKLILLLPLLAMAILPIVTVRGVDNMPSGAVVAFNATAGCPKGWQLFAPAAGRVVVGANLLADKEGESIINEDSKGNLLTVRRLMDQGGSESHKLTLAELPPHNHHNGAYKYLLRKTGQGTYSGASDNTRNEPNLYTAAALKPAGNGKPHNNMPPFVALYYCQKN